MSENAPHAEVATKNMVPWKERFAYSLSDFACNLSFQMVGTYLMIFYTPELFIPSKKVVSFHVFQKLTAFDLAYYVLRL